MSGLVIERNKPQPGEIWQHYKGGKYKIECLAIEEATHELQVVYSDFETTWVRPLREFMQVVPSKLEEKGDVTNCYRFELLNAQQGTSVR